MPVRPKTVRNLLPGVAPVSAGVLEGLSFTKDEGFDGPKESIQIEIEGELRVPEAGQYEFDLDSDDGMRFYLGGAFVGKDAWVNGSKPPSRVEVELDRGWVPVKARFWQGDGGAKLHVRWKPPGAAGYEPIPAGMFRVSSARVEAARERVGADAEVDTGGGGRAYRSIFRTRGFFELPEAEGDLLIDVLEGPTTYSAQARVEMTNLLENTGYAELPYWHQTMVLAGFLRGWPNGRADRGVVLYRDPYEVSDAEAVAYEGWRGAAREGFVQTVTFSDGHEVVVYTPMAKASERDDVPKALAGLPKTLRSMVRTVKVEPYGTASEYNGGGSGFWVRLQGPAKLSSLDSVFAHEVGHVLMSHTDCYLDWQAAAGRDILSVSHYGRLNPSEDFAEFTRLYLGTYGDAEQLESLRKMFPERMGVMDAVLAEAGFVWSEQFPADR